MGYSPHITAHRPVSLLRNWNIDTKPATKTKHRWSERKARFDAVNELIRPKCLFVMTHHHTDNSLESFEISLSTSQTVPNYTDYMSIVLENFDYTRRVCCLNVIIVFVIHHLLVLKKGNSSSLKKLLYMYMPFPAYL